MEADGDKDEDKEGARGRNVREEDSTNDKTTSNPKRKVSTSPQKARDDAQEINNTNNEAEAFDESDPSELEESKIDNHVERDDNPVQRPKHKKGTPMHMQKRNWHVANNGDGEGIGKWVNDKTIRELEKIEGGKPV